MSGCTELSRGRMEGAPREHTDTLNTPRANKRHNKDHSSSAAPLLLRMDVCVCVISKPRKTCGSRVEAEAISRVELCHHKPAPQVNQ